MIRLKFILDWVFMVWWRALREKVTQNDNTNMYNTTARTDYTVQHLVDMTSTTSGGLQLRRLVIRSCIGNRSVR